jgi:hypothetical protein
MHEVLRTLGLAEEHHVAHGEVLYSMDLTTIDGMQAAAARRAAAARSAVHKV